ncbi:MAG: septal ring lytic transglycosylase RlpA family protein [Gammaproteobacteria bacterium]|jgi:rare lipoprotein A
MLLSGLMLRKVTCFTLLLLACVSAQAGPPATVQEGGASYYADSLHGNRTASGEPYDRNAMTAAHRTLPFGTRVRVTYPKTGKSVEVVINDRGPHVEGRIIDLSGAAARALGLTDDGTGQVRLEVISP